MRGAMIRAGNLIPTQTKPHLLTAAFFFNLAKKNGWGACKKWHTGLATYEPAALNALLAGHQVSGGATVTCSDRDKYQDAADANSNARKSSLTPKCVLGHSK